MSKIQNWLNDLTKIAQDKSLKLDINKFSAVQFTEKEAEILDHVTVQNRMTGMDEITGWVQETSKVHRLQQQKFQPTSFVLNAEWVANGSSFSVEHLGQDQWEFKQYQLQLCDISEATHLAEKVMHCEVGKENKSFLVYQRLWQEQENGPIAKIAIFSGFQE